MGFLSLGWRGYFRLNQIDSRMMLVVPVVKPFTPNLSRVEQPVRFADDPFVRFIE